MPEEKNGDTFDRLARRAGSSTTTVPLGDCLPRSGRRFADVLVVDGLRAEGTYGMVVQGLWQERPCALKVLQPMQLNTRASQEDAWREIELLRFFAGRPDPPPGLVRAYDSGEYCQIPYVVLELLSGRTLEGVVEEAGGRIGAKRAIALLLPVCETVVYLHRYGVIHRDLKPSNVFVTRDGRSVLIDLGVAHVPDLGPFASVATPSPTGEVCGTYGYMPPEQALAAAAHPTMDVFALAATLSWLVAGRHPFRRPVDLSAYLPFRKDAWQRELRRRTRAGCIYPLPSSADVPAALRAVIAKALALAPQDRYQTVDAFADALGSVLPKLG